MTARDCTLVLISNKMGVVKTFLHALPWPVGNIIHLADLPPKAGRENKEVERLDASKGHWAQELLMRYTRLVPYLVLTLLSYRYTFPLEEAGGDSWSWVLIPLVRNFVVLNFLYGGWHYILYLSPWCKDDRAKHLKFNSKDQYADPQKNLYREILYCNYGFLMSTAYEVLLMRLWATGALKILPSFWSSPTWSGLCLHRNRYRMD